MGEFVEIIHKRDQDGNKIVLCPLSNRPDKVIMYEHDWHRLYDAGMDPRFRYLIGQVFLRGKKRIGVARLIMSAGTKEKIMYLDSNSLNLKTDNLIRADGGGKFNALDTISLASRPNIEVRHKYDKPSWEE